MATFHIMPVNENHQHSEECPCNPELYEANGHLIITHNSFLEDYDPTFEEMIQEINNPWSEEITPPSKILNLKNSFLLDPENVNLN